MASIEITIFLSFIYQLYYSTDTTVINVISMSTCISDFCFYYHINIDNYISYQK